MVNQRIPVTKYFIVIIALLMIILFSGTSVKTSLAAGKESPELLVGATGMVTIAPDQARISLAITSIEASLAKAQNLNNQSAQNVLSVLEQNGIDQKDIETVNYNVYPQYNYNSTSTNNSLPQITGYKINNEISVVVKNLDNVGKILDAAVKAGANNVNYIIFERADLAVQENTALAKAVARARSKAETIATAAGMTLGKVTQISADRTNTVFPDVHYYSQKDLTDYQNENQVVPINPGELQITANVYIVYELK